MEARVSAANPLTEKECGSKKLLSPEAAVTKVGAGSFSFLTEKITLTWRTSAP